MKKLFTFLFIFLCCIKIQAQFSSDATMPLAICNAANQQSNVRAIEDDISSSGGYFVFWLDKRLDGSNANIYAQKLDPDGNALWESNGKQILQTDYSITALEVVKWQQGLLMSYIVTNGFFDSVKCIYLNADGQNIWAAPALLAYSNTIPPVLSVQNAGCFNIFPTSTGATIAYYLIFFGGAGAIAYNKIDFNGNVELANNSKVFTLSGYDYRSLSDGQDGLYLLSKGNGIGSTITIDRLDASGISTWPSIEITAGGGTLGFAGDISMCRSANNDLYVTWDAANNQVYTTKILSTGAFAWSPSRISISQTATAGRSYANINSSDTLCVTWIETPSTTTYAMIQKIGNSGGLSFPVGGKIVDIANGYYAYPKLAFDNDNTVCFFSTTTNTVAIGAQSIKQDNSFNWTDTKILCDNYLKWISYQDYVVLNSTNDCNAIFWTGFDQNIYGASTCKIEDVMSLQTGSLAVENVDNRNKISWKTYNQISGDKYEIQRSENGIDFTTLSTISANVYESEYTYWDENPITGLNYYKLKLINADGRIECSNIVSARVKAYIKQINAYPNPVKNKLQISLTALPTEHAQLTIFNALGSIVQHIPISSKTVSIDMTNFAKGIYYLSYKDDVYSQRIKIIKD